MHILSFYINIIITFFYSCAVLYLQINITTTLYIPLYNAHTNRHYNICIMILCSLWPVCAFKDNWLENHDSYHIVNYFEYIKSTFRVNFTRKFVNGTIYFNENRSTGIRFQLVNFYKNSSLFLCFHIIYLQILFKILNYFKYTN